MAQDTEREREPARETVSIFHPQVILLSTGLSVGLFMTYRFYKTYLRRVETCMDIPNSVLRNRTLLGKVTSVGDGDNFHFYHTPGGYLAGWGLWRKIPDNRKELRNQTLHIRLCGVDAPERAHFGKKAQPYSEEALTWLRSYVLGRRVRVKPFAIDQYKRVVGKATVVKLTGRKDVSAEMIRNGLGVVYEGKTGAEFDGKEDHYRKLEKAAKGKKKGMWILGNKMVTPGQFKSK